MPITAQSIILRVTGTLGDITSIKWTVDRLVRYLNDGQRDILIHRPDAYNVPHTLALAVGHKQALPAGGQKLIDVLSNTAGSKRAVTKTQVKTLDAQVRNWRSMTPTLEILHFMYDPREPKSFEVYPPAADGASLEIEYAAVPADITEPTAGQLYSDVTGNISVSDLFANALADYVLYRCHAELSEEAQPARAQAHYGAYLAALGVEAQATAAVAPTE